MYRPFCKHYAYFNRTFNERVYQMPQIFPEPGMVNEVSCVLGKGAVHEFCTLITDTLPDLETVSKAQCFPLYTYERIDQSRNLQIAQSDGVRVGDYVRRENISDAMLKKFNEYYEPVPPTTEAITKEDIFYYIYGLLHSRSYRERFASDLKKQLPRIPMVDDFKTFSKAGRQLAELHLNYETGKMYPLEEIATGSVSFKVVQMRYPSKTDKSKIIYNGTLTLDGIPSEAYRYIVNGKSALDWIMERYAVTTHKDSGIVNDPNDWCREIGNERYIVDLIKRIVHLSVESVKIIEALPGVGF
jgi:predicted helicase